MSELDRKQAWDGFLSLLRQMRFDDDYKEELAAAYEKYLATLKRDGFPTDDTMVIMTEAGPIVVRNSEIPQRLRSDLSFLKVIRHIWGGI